MDAKMTLVWLNMVMVAVLVVNSVVSLLIFWRVIQKYFYRCQIQKWVFWIIASSFICILNESYGGLQ
jgi:cytochrome bd-type quinol oxidase subunit 1